MRLFAICITTLLSQNNMASSLFLKKISSNKPLNQTIFAAVDAILLNSASTDDLEIIFCFLNFHEINEFPIFTQYLVTNFLNIRQYAQSESQYAINLKDPFR
ncbi:hypothetical protein V6Z11_A01G136900 [Gossypium hirsutum]